jgi:hypothetical protein
MRVFYFRPMANQYILFTAVPVMKTVSLAILETPAIFALTHAHPVPVAKRVETLFPYVVEIIGVNVSL